MMMTFVSVKEGPFSLQFPATYELMVSIVYISPVQFLITFTARLEQGSKSMYLWIMNLE